MTQRPRIAVIAPITARYDAISGAARANFRLLASQEEWDATYLTAYNELPDLPARITPGVVELLMDAEFRSADMLIYHFGIYNPLIDALLIGNGHAKQVVVFHNITPAELVLPAERPLIERSFRQLHNLSHADEIWADSEFNRQVLTQHGIEPRSVTVVPLAVERPTLGSLRQKLAPRIEILFVGRIVPAKGVYDLIQAGHLVRQAGGPQFRIRIAGNLTFSNAAYLADCEAFARSSGLTSCIEFVGTPDDATLDRLYAEAHILGIPSYHEGFCVPVVEALRGGCVPVGYAAGNIPAVAGGLGRLVPTGDVGALAAALGELSWGIVRACDAVDASKLWLDRGLLAVGEFDIEARVHTARYAARNVEAIKIAHIRPLLRI